MIQIGIEINEDDINRITTASRRVNQVARIQSWLHPYECSTDYKNLLKNAILTQKYALSFSPYSPRYAEWKTVKMLRGSHFWRLYGDLLRSIVVEKRGDGWFAGIPSTAYDSGGKSWFSTRKQRRGGPKPIAMYARVMELGLNNHPARAVFGPALREYIDTGWRKRGEQSLKRIGAAWK